MATVAEPVTASLAEIPIGPRYAPSPVADVRTPAQREAVRQIVTRPEFDYANSNPLRPEVGDYAGHFFFNWFDTDGRQWMSQIDRNGNIAREIFKR